jgi:hypothetical protein
MERIIKFPFPKYKSCFDNEDLLQKSPFCLCYQYNLNKDHQYGPYGFDTEKAQLILRRSFLKLYFWDEVKRDILKTQVNILRRGIYFYDNEDYIEQERKSISSYFIQKRKNEILRKNEPIESIPFLLKVSNNNKFSVNFLNQLINENINFFIVDYFTPEAGNSLIFFNNSILKRIMLLAKQESVNFDDVESIDNLKAW